MTDGNTYEINRRLDEREDWDALEEVTAELEQAGARIEELEAKLAEAVCFITDIEAGPRWGESLPSWVSTRMLKARTTLAELKGQ